VFFLFFLVCQKFIEGAGYKKKKTVIFQNTL